MPLYHCNKCQHEWEGIRINIIKCGWCGSEGGYILQEETQFEKFIHNKDLFINNFIKDMEVKHVKS
jgi:formate dehydrogenase maturation protein FdhE